jgi:hypothetical protein
MYSPNDLLGLKFLKQLLGRIEALFVVHVPDATPIDRVSRCGYSKTARKLSRLWIFGEEFWGIHADRGESRKPFVQPGVVNPVRMQLFFEIFIRANLLNALDIPRSRPKTDPVQQVFTILHVRIDSEKAIQV